MPALTASRTLSILLWVTCAACIARLWIAPLPSSFWVDEMVTAFVVHHPGDPSFAIAPQVPESVYYRLPRAAVSLFGDSEIVYRLPSVLAMGLALILIGRLAARLMHPGAAWFAVFASLGLRWINYPASDARPYALGICVSAAALLSLIRWLDAGHWRDALLFTACAALLWRVHLIYWPCYLVFFFYFMARIAERNTPVRATHALAVVLLLAAALAPVAWEALQILHDARAHVITTVPDPRQLEHQIRWSLVAICGGGAWLIARFTGNQATTRPSLQGSSLFLILIAWLTQPVCLYLFSRLTHNSVFVDRYLSVAQPGTALTATAAAGLSVPAKYWRAFSLILGAGVLIAMGEWRSAVPRHDRSDWRAASQEENRQVTGPATPVICPSPFVEARSPVWYPQYPLPGFLYAHLAYYPLKGKLYLFPFETADGKRFASEVAGTLARTGRFMIYGGDRNVKYWRDWFAERPEFENWKSNIERFGDVALAIFDRT